ncbi:hypothetical protein EDB85DRAFT_1900712 [Lactarius pseudohatsudake]|nr:hypothetical protein EDB85DRAFT_1900712 [Lactarius pseudohatsudake]
MRSTNLMTNSSGQGSGIKFHTTSKLICPDCKKTVCVGFGGKKNLDIHRTSKACQRKQGSKSKGPKRAPERPPKPDRPNHDLRAFFKPCVPLVPPTVVAPLPDKASFSGLSDNLEVLETHARTPRRKYDQVHTRKETLEEEEDIDVEMEVPLGAPPPTSAGKTQGKTPCRKGIELLNKLEAALMRIPNSVPLAPQNTGSQGSEVDSKDDWMVLNSMMKTVFGWGESEMQKNTKEMLNCSAHWHGLDGFIQFFKYFVLQRGLEGMMIETKVNGLLCEIEYQYAPVPVSTLQSVSAPAAIKKVTANVRKTDSVPMPALAIASGTVESPIVLDHVSDRVSEACFDARSDVTKRALDNRSRIGASVEGRLACCEGVLVLFPHGKNHHISYPFGIHNERDLPWDYCSTRDKFYIQAKQCRKPPISKGNACNDCQALTSIPLYISIMDRIRHGVHENALLVYHGVRGLIEVARHKIEQVRQLRRLTKLNASRRLLGKAAALDDHKQWMMAIASGRVERVTSLVQAGLKHKAGIKTLIQQYERAAEKLYQPKFLQSLIISPSAPTVAEVERNIMSCNSGLASISDTLDLALDSGTSSGGLQVVHQVIMFNELAIEQRVHWDDSTNKFLGICREHGHEIPLEFTSERELNILCNVISNNMVHLASEATVAGIGALSEVPCTCKRETGPQHARVLQMVLEAANKVKVRKNCTHRTVCVASDGEAKRGDAFVILTMSSQLSASSLIYGQLSLLKLMNHLVGPDDLTADKDFKHDVILTYSLLKEVWLLPPPPAGSSPSFARAREALNIYGQFAHHLMMPYVCVDLNLDEQLIYLSVAAHMAFFLYRDGLACTQFMLTQSYVDIMIMVKNMFYCVAKAKADNPHGNFYPILLGTDRLETFFGLIRTAVGTDANINVLQLGSRASGLTEVALILAEHPEWDLGPRRLTLPRITKDAQAGEITSKFNHISPKDWRGDTTVARVNIHSCWLLGRQQAIKCIPDAGHVFKQLLAEGTPNIDMLSLLGTLLVNHRDPEHDNRDNTDDFARDLGPEPEGPEHIPSDAMQNANISRTALSLPLSYMHDGDLEDAIADEMPRNNVDSTIIVQGQKTSKAKALRHRMASRTTRSSTDRLRCVQNIPCFGPTSTGIAESDPWSGSITPCDDTTLGPTLCIGNPVALLVRCGTIVVLAVAQVNRLWFASQSNLDELAVHLLADPTAKVDCQLLCLVPATVEDDPTHIHDWCWSMQMEANCENIDGVTVLAVDTYEYSCDSFGWRALCVTKNCPTTWTQTVKAAQDAGRPWTGRMDNASSNIWVHTSYTMIYLRKAHGTAGSVSVDRKKSKCINMTHFNYATAFTSSEASPCSNVPIICPHCPNDSPAVWTYSLHAHFRERHCIQSPGDFPITICLSQSEKDGMRKVWNSRFKAPKQHKKKLNQPSLAILEAHHARLYLQPGAGDKDNQEDDLHNINFHGDSSHPLEDTMEQDLEQGSSSVVSDLVSKRIPVSATVPDSCSPNCATNCAHPWIKHTTHRVDHIHPQIYHHTPGIIYAGTADTSAGPQIKHAAKHTAFGFYRPTI